MPALRQIALHALASTSLALAGACATSTSRRAESVAQAAQPVQFTLFRDTAEVRLATQAIVADYADRFARMGLPLGPLPRVDVLNTREIISFNGPAITVPFGPGMPPPMRSLFAEWAGGAAQGDTLVAALFNWMTVAHELTHWFQLRYGSVADRYASERMANEFAVAYWMERGEEARLAALERVIARAASSLPDPTPPGADAERYFAEHYAELGADPRKYAFYQFKTGLAALARRRELHLSEMAHAYAARPKSQAATPTVTASVAPAYAIAPARLSAFVGAYEVAPERNFVVTSADGALLGDFPIQPGTKHSMRATSATEFDVGEGYRVFFDVDASGTVTHATLRQGQQIVWRAARLRP